MLAKLIGSSSLLADPPERCAHRTTRGANIAMSGVLGMNDDSAAVLPASSGTDGRLFSSRSMSPTNAPVAVAAPATT